MVGIVRVLRRRSLRVNKILRTTQHSRTLRILDTRLPLVNLTTSKHRMRNKITSTVSWRLVRERNWRILVDTGKMRRINKRNCNTRWVRRNNNKIRQVYQPLINSFLTQTRILISNWDGWDNLCRAQLPVWEEPLQVRYHLHQD